MNDPDASALQALAPPPWRLRLQGTVELRDAARRPVRLPTRAVTLLLA